MLPDLPLELWHRILECTCTCSADNNNKDGDNKYCFDCTTPRILSSTCRELRRLSRHHRFHSVTIRGWEQLLQFEKLFASTIVDSEEGDGQGRRKHDSSIVYLHVEIEQLWSVVYPRRADDDHDDGSEASEDSSGVDTSDSEGGEGIDGDEDDAEDPGLAEERAYDFTEISDMESAEVAEDLAAIAEDEQEEKACSWFDRTHSAQELSFLLTFSPTPLAGMEFIVYSALRRLLEACAPTLKVLSLSWEPISTFFIEAVFPLLPELRVLCWDCDQSGRNRLHHTLSIERKAPVPLVFPALHHLDIKTNSNPSVLGSLLLMCPDVRVVSLSLEMLNNDWSIHKKKVRVRVGSSYQGNVGRLDKEYACERLGVRSTMEDNDFYAIPTSKVHHLSMLLRRLIEEVEGGRIIDVEGDDGPGIQHAIDVCTDLVQWLGCV